MRYIKYTIVFIIIGLCYNNSNAQIDPHYTLNAQPLYYSPSLTGVFNGSVRFNSIYRSQWQSVLGNDQYQTIGASIDFRRPAQDGDLIGIGFSGWNDQSSINNFRQRCFNVSGAFAKKLGQNRGTSLRHYLSAGGQFGFGELRISSSSFLFSTQFDGVWIDSNLPNQEGLTIGDLTTQFVNINAGLSYYVIDKKNGNYALLSTSAYHVNTPNISFFQIDGTVEEMPVRWSIYEAAQYSINDNIAIIQYGTFNFQAPFSQFIFGGQFRYQPHRDSKALRIGTTVRIGRYSNITEIDAISPTVGVEINNLLLQAAFDMNISEFSEFTNYRGGLEVSVTYVNPTKKRGAIVCPRF
ncbi:MAG: PorP/SprF family type IX secretion system membrane protein [Saprospiraceae bacterium]